MTNTKAAIYDNLHSQSNIKIAFLFIADVKIYGYTFYEYKYFFLSKQLLISCFKIIRCDEFIWLLWYQDFLFISTCRIFEWWELLVFIKWVLYFQLILFCSIFIHNEPFPLTLCLPMIQICKRDRTAIVHFSGK